MASVWLEIYCDSNLQTCVVATTNTGVYYSVVLSVAQYQRFVSDD